MKTRYFHALFLLYLISTAGCMNVSEENTAVSGYPSFLLEGHRGTRGRMPENTIASMKQAIRDGANTIEVDIQISKDEKVMVAHDPYINRQISLLPDGSEIPEQDAHRYVLYQMPYDSIRRFDVGSKVNPGFPDQEKFNTYIPLLGELIDSVEQFTRADGYDDVIYNIEIKSRTDQDGVLQPPPSELVALVMDVVGERDLEDRFYIQSFDVRQIQEVHARYPGVATGFLTSSKEMSLEANLDTIGFTPDIYSPHFSLANAGLIKQCQEKGMKFVPWTVNNGDDMRTLLAKGVDGIITDYPDVLRDVLEEVRPASP